MKVLLVNVCCGTGSTGRICTDIALDLEKQGHDVKIAYGRDDVPEQFKKYAVRIGTDWDVKLHGVKARLLDGMGFGSRAATEKFIEWVKEYNPDVIHLHNIHGYYINIEVLFNYLKTCGKKIIWTLHDCWAFTGHCAYFDYVGCEKWKNGCYECAQKTEYPTRIGPDFSQSNYSRKKVLFTGIPNLTIVTPSKWLAGLVKQSFLEEYSVKVIYNGVDTSVFKPTPSDVKERLNLKDKKIILGIAAVWDRRKGLKTFIELNNRLDKNRYKIILVGVSKNQIKSLPNSIIGITSTDSTIELAELYSAADLFINPTLEDNYPTTNIEAISCGTPVITYDTGGSPESAKKYGYVVEKGDFNELINAISLIDKLPKRDISFNKDRTVEEYIKLYSYN